MCKENMFRDFPVVQWLVVIVVAKSCPTLCNPMDCSMPGFPVVHCLLEFAWTHVHWVGDAIQSSHSLLSPLPPALSLSQHQGLFKWVSLCIRWPNYWNFSFSISPSNEYSGLIFSRIDWFDLAPRDSQEDSQSLPVLGLGAFTAMAQIQSLVEDPFRSHKLCGVVKGKKKKTTCLHWVKFQHIIFSDWNAGKGRHFKHTWSLFAH